ncbi:hypothetical protein N752_08055 [Desulforamulus aquiferis]|nr:hypothetical protein N752_08055 [Desulforamulus aquiferis]
MSQYDPRGKLFFKTGMENVGQVARTKPYHFRQTTCFW